MAASTVSLSASASLASPSFFSKKVSAAKPKFLFASSPSLSSRSFKTLRASSESEIAAANAEGDSIVPEVAQLPEEGSTEGVAPKKLSPLQKGGTLEGQKAAGKDPGPAALGKSAFSIVGEKFSDPRWKNGTWDILQFTKDGKVNWDAVIDAEVFRRKWLEENPESSNNEDPVVFETADIPWWAWVRRFHLPEAEKLNGRAAMIGYALGYLVDSASGVGLVDQTNSFLGKLLLFISVLGVLFIRKNEDLTNLRGLADEWTFYDRQWQASWKDSPSSKKDE